MPHQQSLQDAFLSGMKSIDALHRVVHDVHGRRPGAAVQLDKWEESDDTYEVTIEAPGLRVSDLTATLEQDGDTTTIKLDGETKTQRRHSKIVRRITLPANS